MENTSVVYFLLSEWKISFSIVTLAKLIGSGEFLAVSLTVGGVHPVDFLASSWLLYNKEKCCNRLPDTFVPALTAHAAKSEETSVSEL